MTIKKLKIIKKLSNYQTVYLLNLYKLSWKRLKNIIIVAKTWLKFYFFFKGKKCSIKQKLLYNADHRETLLYLP